MRHPPFAARVGLGMRRKLIAAWGVGWVLWLLGRAVWKLTPLALEPWTQNLMSSGQKWLYLGWLVLNAYAEGYRGFQKRFSPRVVSRAAYLGQNPTPLRVVLALPFCMSLFHATRRQRWVSWIFIVVLVAVIIAVRALPQPWRGIIDGGVVIGLGWGMLVIVWLFARYLVTGLAPEATDLPTQPQTAAVAP